MSDKPKRRKDDRNLTREYIESLVVAVVIALVLRTFVIAAYKIPTGSMIPTLKIGDCIFAWKLPYGIRIPFTDLRLTKPRMPGRGDVVVFRAPEDPSISYVKRVVGLPGDKIEIRQKRLIINDRIVPYQTISSEVMGDVPLKELYILQFEKFEDKSHYVTFRRGEDEDSYGPAVVPEDKFFVLGDNRDSSDDSRFWGAKAMVPVENLEGRAVVIWCSFNWDKKQGTFGIPALRSERIFSLIR